MIEDSNEAASTEQELREDEEDERLRTGVKAGMFAGSGRVGTIGATSVKTGGNTGAVSSNPGSSGGSTGNASGIKPL